MFTARLEQAAARTRRARGEPIDLSEKGTHAAPSRSIQCAATEVSDDRKCFDNLPRFIWHRERVQTVDEKRSHWFGKAS